MEVKRQTAQGNLDYDQFTTLIRRMLIAAWGDKWGTFVADAPTGGDPTDIKLPIITYQLSKLTAGKVGENRREIRPRLRNTYREQNIDGNAPPITEILGQYMDAEIVFEVWEESNAKAEKLAKKFRDFMKIYAGYFKEQGLKEIYFILMSATPNGEILRDNSVCRKLVYFVKFEELTEVPVDIIKTIEVAAEIARQEELEELLDKGN